MRTLDAIYKKYKEERTPEIEELLCKRIEKLAGIVLHQFKIRRNNPNYEEYMQSAYLLFFELLETFDPNIGKLEGYFMTHFKFLVIDLIKDRLQRADGLVGDEVLDEKNPYNHFLVDNLVDKLYEKLDKFEQIVVTYLIIGIDDVNEIAQREETDPMTVDTVLTKVRKRAEKVFFDTKKEREARIL